MLEPRGALRLRYLTGPQRGATAVLRPPRVRIGRSRDNDITLADREGAAASAHHAEAVREGGQWWIHDLRSTNGTSLNGVRITRAPFGPGDRLQFGDIECDVLPGRFALRLTAAVAAIAIASVGAYLLLSRSSGFETAAASVARSVYAVAIERERGRELIGTAFVVGDGLLATNAHVAAAIQSAPASPTQHSVVVRSDLGEVHAIDEIHISPQWRKGSLAHDVALLRVRQLAPDARALVLADAGRLATLARGTIVGTFGFPANGTDPARPRGRLVQDVLGDVRDGQYLAVGLRIAPGTSGSPIFLPDGVVIGIVAGGDFVTDPTGAFTPSGTNVNWGLSVAPLQQLIRECTAERR